MQRTQIYLSDDIVEVVARLARASGKTKSQIIRDAIVEACIRSSSRPSLSEALHASAGAWTRRTRGERFVEQRRRGRLAGLHGRDPS